MDKLLKTEVYFHNNKESNNDLIDTLEEDYEIELSGKAKNQILYLGYEIKVNVEINPINGKCIATHLNDVKLEKPVII